MFERFTDRARRVVVLAQEEARLLDHGYIGTEHLLLGLIHEGEGVAAKALESLGISLAAVRQQVEAIIGRGQQAPSGHLPFTSRAKQALELSRRGTGLNRVRQQVSQLLHAQAGKGAIGEGETAGSRGRAGLADDALARIESVDRRLAVIERWVGIRPDLDDLDEEIARSRGEKEVEIDTQDFNAAAALRDKEKELLAKKASSEKEHAAGSSLADEVGRLNAELARLHAILRDHGIEPGKDAA